MNKDKWIWMPHAGHFICANSCRFHLNTYIGGYIVSTVGEMWPDSRVRAINAESLGIEIKGRGDEWDADYMKKIGFDEIGYKRKYETMVFKAEKRKHACCPWGISSGTNLDFAGYNKAEDAFKGHMKLCIKWSKKK